MLSVFLRRANGGLVAGILAFRRLPMVVALRRFVPPLDHPEATAFVGWFGPIGVAVTPCARMEPATTRLTTGQTSSMPVSRTASVA